MTNEALLLELGGHFKPNEFGVGFERMNLVFLEHFARFRQWHGFPTMLTSSYRTSGTGAHTRGLAVDSILWKPGKFRVQTLNPVHQYNLACAFGFKGVGLYFDWNADYRDGKRKQAVGIHVDDDTEGSRPLRWLRIEGRYFYLNFETNRFVHTASQTDYSMDEAIQLFWNE